MTVLRHDRQRWLALCSDEAGAHSTIQTELVGELEPGDRVLVHAGVALVALT
jgi:hydrogenase maturation factor